MLPPRALTVEDLPAESSVIACAAVGRLVTHAGTGVTVPEPGMKAAVDALTVNGSAHGFTLEVDADGRISYDLTDTAAAKPAPAAAAPARADGACDDGAYATAGRKKYGTYQWFLGDGPLPGGLSRADARRAFEEAITTITTSRNDCGLADKVSAKARYVSRTGRRAGIDRRGHCTARDGLSVWDTGDLGGDVVALTCSWSRRIPGRPDALREADVRFNVDDYVFTNSPSAHCTDAYDIRSVATHEAGHVFGLAHVGPGHEGLTMYPTSFVCSTSARTLGRGDVLGLRALY
ncbi:matrixin family metalloprotease [Streptomyces sp. T028]|uniref:matrixin family metalloprotease n=1 Tax=Streptomyces sp. T028 TaxID=3394379 RepID=UPI003A8A010D